MPDQARLNAQPGSTAAAPTGDLYDDAQLVPMEEAPGGSPVGVDDPYEVAGRCDHLTDDGRCRLALAYAGVDPEFARERAAEDYECVAGESRPEGATRNSRAASDASRETADDDAEFADCEHYRWTTDGKECFRCGLEEVRLAHEDARPLVEEHHLSYGSGRDAGETGAGGVEDRDRTDGDDDEAGNENVASGDAAHEITIALCRWCHSKVHNSFARVTDDASPDPEAVAAREARRSEEQSEFGFDSALERYDEG